MFHIKQKYKEFSEKTTKFANNLSKMEYYWLVNSGITNRIRIDIQVEIMPVPFDELSSLRQGESSEAIRRRVVEARHIQSVRYAGHPGVFCNAQMTSKMLTEYGRPDREGLEMLRTAMDRFNMSARAYDRILKVARTIADLDKSTEVKSRHIAEAISYRNLDRSNWGQTYRG